MAQQLLVVGDTHEEDEESEAAMSVVYRHLEVLHESECRFRLRFESDNRFTDALSKNDTN